MDRSVRDRGVYAFGSFRLDAARRLLTRAGASVILTPTVFDTLLYLVENPGRVVSKDELLDAIWPRRVVEESNISQTIFMLRKALGGGGEADHFIVTAPGQGYRFTAEVRLEIGGRPLPPAPAGEVRAWSHPGADAPPPGGLPGLWRRRPFQIGVAAGALIVAAGVVILADRPRAPSRHSADRSLVVLADFQNQTHEPVFDRSLGKALEIDLDQSPVVTVAPEQQVQDTLVLMARSKDAPLTRPLAEEVCARDDGRAVLDGAVAAVGAKYLLTLTATDCTGERVLAAEKIQADTREAVIPALDRLTSRMRAKLGESLPSIEKFHVPLLAERTPSLEALKAYSEGAWLYNHGRRVDSIPMFQHAIELDPSFAAAWANLSSVYYSLNQDSLDAAAISKAYALRDTVSERERFQIVSRYQESVTKDVDQAIRNFQVWSETYPQDPAAWNGLSNAENWIGRYPQAIEAGERALAVSPNSETTYVVLARAYMHAGQLDKAKAVCARAIAKGLDGDATHGQLLRIAFAAGDQAGAARELAWARGKTAEHSVLLIAALDAYARGEVGRGEDLFAQAVGLAKSSGLGDVIKAPRARMLADFGLTDRAKGVLGQIPAGFDSADYRFTMAEIGDAARAQAVLRGDLVRSPTDTLLNDVYAPEVAAALDMRRGAPGAAVVALRPALPYEARNYDITYLRGLAYLGAADGAHAAGEFQTILAHPGVDSVSPLYPLARLGLARAYRLQHDLPASRRQYQTFFAAWKNADSDLPVLQSARAEYAAL